MDPAATLQVEPDAVHKAVQEVAAACKLLARAAGYTITLAAEATS
jgi:hypothetical protein